MLLCEYLVECHMYNDKDIGRKTWLNCCGTDLLCSFVLLFFICHVKVFWPGMAQQDVVVDSNGQTFRFNELVHICEGTAPGVRPKKTEFLKAW